MDALRDDELLTRTPSCPDAFAVFYRRHELLVLSYLQRRTRDPELAADLAAESFAVALLNVRRFDPARGDAVAWLLGIARNQLRRAWERRRVDDRARRRLGMPVLVLDDDALERVLRSEGADRVSALLARLPPDQAAAIRARILDEEPYAGIATRVRCSESTVRQRVSRGLATLRHSIEEPTP